MLTSLDLGSLLANSLDFCYVLLINGIRANNWCGSPLPKCMVFDEYFKEGIWWPTQLWLALMFRHGEKEHG